VALQLDPEVERIVRERASMEGISVRDLLMRTFAAGGEREDPEARVRTLLAQWQAQDGMQTGLPLGGPETRSANEALLARWREADAGMTEEEREAEDDLWADVERGLDETRARLGMRPLSP